MPQDDSAFTKELDRVFQQASMTYVMSQLRKPDDFTRAHAIIQAAQMDRDSLEKEFQTTFDDRVVSERARLLEDTTHKTLDHPAPPDMPHNTEYTIEQTARRNVLLSHEADLQQVDRNTNRALEDLMSQTRAREARQGHAMRDFNQATDRRVTYDRRDPTRSR